MTKIFLIFIELDETSAKKTCFQFAECNSSYTKIRLSLVTSKVLGKNVRMQGIQKGGL